MIFVVVEELIPKSHHAGNIDPAKPRLMRGFALMMAFDVGLGWSEPTTGAGLVQLLHL